MAVRPYVGETSTYVKNGVGRRMADAAIKSARYYDLGPDDVVMTVATDGYSMYGSERDKAMGKYFPAGFDAISAFK